MTRLYYGWDREELPHQFQVSEEPSRFTGVLDHRGEPIYRHPEPVGFVTDFTRQKPRIRVKAVTVKA